MARWKKTKKNFVFGQVSASLSEKKAFHGTILLSGFNENHLSEWLDEQMGLLLAKSALDKKIINLIIISCYVQVLFWEWIWLGGLSFWSS
ncbi:hypothetical protein [Pedobacter sp. SL55]|uniref:hypothetical protein n=1 Tax=Pedobacter sp. SL55 TaxID=2995161 RepID=UPI0022709AC4|nr:hypothetical protein [Pedobacter sp. SL55]WAC39398.1 hypothetical protein OVA16_12390 [Pedobacter sp. SL55]